MGDDRIAIARNGVAVARDRRAALRLLAALAQHLPLAGYLAAAQAVRSRRFARLLVSFAPGRVEYADLRLRLSRSEAEGRLDDALERGGWGYAGTTDEDTPRGYGAWVVEP